MDIIIIKGCSVSKLKHCVFSVTRVYNKCDGRNHLQHTRIVVALARGNFLLFLAKKTIENAHVPKRQLHAYATNDSTLGLNKETTRSPQGRL